MKKYFTLLSLLFLSFHMYVFAQTYTHSTSGIAGTYVGDCMVNTCSGSYYDNGGSGGNYSNNINAIYRVFCPNTAGNCISATFNSFSSEKIGATCTRDYLTIGNGATQNSTTISIAGITDASNRICGTPTVPFTATSSETSGCLTFRFTSSASTNDAGWDATISCSSCAIGPDGTENSDCVNATPVCNDVSITSNAEGPGLTSEACTGCTAGGENYSNWYTFTFATGGTLGLTIDPDISSDDYDFALYGPGVSCGGLGTPVRCSYAANPGNTGLKSTVTDVSEDVLGNGWVDTLHVNAGETYYLMVNHWTAAIDGYILDWSLTDGATLDCDVLPIELTAFAADQMQNTVLVEWVSATETNNSHFELEKSVDGIQYTHLATVEGNNYPSTYWVSDNNPVLGNNYYRLTQVDFGGHKTFHGTRVCNFKKTNNVVTFNILDLSGRMVYNTSILDNDLESTLQSLDLEDGIYIYQMLYQDGTSVSGKFLDAR